MIQKQELSEMQKTLFEKISKSDADGLKGLLAQIDGVNFVDDNGMSPLQHACYKGSKDAVQLLLDQGADVNYCQHGANYTPLHFAALSGNKDILLLLLDAGANPNSLNSVSRTAAQMAAFVGFHVCVATINNYWPKLDIEYYTKLQGQQVEPYLPSVLLEGFHKFIIQTNLHPVRLALNIQKFGALADYLKNIKKVLQLMVEKEMEKKYDRNEIMAFKFHYLSWIAGEIIRCQEHFEKQSKKGDENGGDVARHDFIELYIKRVLKENKLGHLDYLEFTIRDCAREFNYRESTIFSQIVTQLADRNSPPALTVLRNAINGQRGFVDEIVFCSTCGEENPDKKCSKCKEVQYCDRECQRLHWFMHKKNCARPGSQTQGSSSGTPSKPKNDEINTDEISDALANLAPR